MTVTVTLTAEGDQHQVVVPRHREVRVGKRWTRSIIIDVAAFLGLAKQAIRDLLFRLM